MEEIIYSEQTPTIDQYYPLFLSTGWNKIYNFSKVDVLKAISNTWYSISAYDANELIGYGRVISDGIHHAFIVDLIIRPEYQKKGIGSKIVSSLVRQCKEHKIRDIQLLAPEDKVDFYLKNGFEFRQDNFLGMHLRMEE